MINKITIEDIEIISSRGGVSELIARMIQKINELTDALNKINNPEYEP